MEMRPGATGRYKLRDHVQPINAQFWPTPTTRDYRHSGSKEGYEKRKGKHVQALNEEACWGKNGIGKGGSLNPEFVEYLMGYPIGFTDCEHSETASSQPSLNESDEQ